MDCGLVFVLGGCCCCSYCWSWRPAVAVGGANTVVGGEVGCVVDAVVGITLGFGRFTFDIGVVFLI